MLKINANTCKNVTNYLHFVTNSKYNCDEKPTKSSKNVTKYLFKCKGVTNSQVRCDRFQRKNNIRDKYPTKK